MTTKPLIHAMWEHYQKCAVPQKAEEIQIKQTRWAFYAGASAMLQCLFEMFEKGGEPGSPENVATVHSIAAELDVFFDLAREGKL